MSSGRPLLRITSSVPDTSYELPESVLTDPDETHDFWAFRDAMLYAFPLPPNAPPGQPNHWIMKIREVDTFNRQDRYVELDLGYNHAGELTGVHVQLTDGRRPERVVAWPYVEEDLHFSEDPCTGKRYKTEFFHSDLMMMLECPTSQRDLLSPPGVAMTPARFYLNFVTSLEIQGVISKFSLDMLTDLLNTQY